jgi:enoyl-CoA hydratase/carnithine racemase
MTQVRLDIDGAIATIVLTRPEARNALTEDMGRELGAAVRALDTRSEVRVAIVRGEGPAFSAGGDLAFIADRLAATPDDNRRTMRAFYQLYLDISTSRVPTIAALHGSVVGAAVCFALACDIRIASTDAKLALNFVRLGLHPGMGATRLLPRLVGVGVASSLLLTGRTVDAAEALRIGLVDAVHPEVTAGAIALATQIAEAAPRAVASTMAALRAYDADELDHALEAEAREQALGYASGDVAEGLRAARERRTPVFP